MKTSKGIYYVFLLFFYAAVYVLIFSSCHDSVAGETNINITCDKACQNGGTVITDPCSCNCPVRYEGEFCEIEKKPYSIKIDKVTVLAWPAKKAYGKDWDPTSRREKRRADPFIRIWHFVNGNGVELYRSIHKTDPEAEKELNYTPKGGVKMEYPDDTYQITLYDEDFGDDKQFMGGGDFVPWTEKLQDKGFPGSFDVVASNGRVRFRVYVSYVHD